MNNYYDEYLYVNGRWELIGSTDVDLTNYYTKSEVDDLLDGYYTKQETNTVLDDYYTKQETDTVLGGYYTKQESDERYQPIGTSFNYNNALNKPSINNVTLSGNKTLKDLGLTTIDEVSIRNYDRFPERVGQITGRDMAYPVDSLSIGDVKPYPDYVTDAKTYCIPVKEFTTRNVVSNAIRFNCQLLAQSYTVFFTTKFVMNPQTYYDEERIVSKSWLDLTPGSQLSGAEASFVIPDDAEYFYIQVVENNEYDTPNATFLKEVIGLSRYTELTNKPKIEGHELGEDNYFSSLGIGSASLFNGWLKFQEHEVVAGHYGSSNLQVGDQAPQGYQSSQYQRALRIQANKLIDIGSDSYTYAKFLLNSYYGRPVNAPFYYVERNGVIESISYDGLNRMEDFYVQIGFNNDNSRFIVINLDGGSGHIPDFAQSTGMIKLPDLITKYGGEISGELVTGKFSVGERPVDSDDGYSLWVDGTAKVKQTLNVGTSAFISGSVTVGSRDTGTNGSKSASFGYENVASGQCSQAEGWAVQAKSDYSHAEGYFTVAKGQSQHAEGECNIEDTVDPNTGKGEYLHIAGNGTTSTPSNAYTLDWSGNAWFSGDVYTGSTSGTHKDAGSKKLATEDSVPVITYSTTDLTPGVSQLAEGNFYFVYE